MADVKTVLQALGKVLDSASKELFAELERLDDGKLLKLVDGTLAFNVKVKVSLSLPKKVSPPPSTPVPMPFYNDIERIIREETHTELEAVQLLMSRSRSKLNANELKAFAEYLKLNEITKSSNREEVAKCIAKHYYKKDDKTLKDRFRDAIKQKPR